jgi:hypothetical protein
LHRSVIVFGGDYVLHAEIIPALFHLHILPSEHRDFTVITKSLIRDNHVDLHRARGSFLLRVDDLHTQCQCGTCTDQCEYYRFVLHVALL